MEQAEDIKDWQKYDSIRAEVTGQTRCADNGVAIHLSYSRDRQYEYIINGANLAYHQLLARATSKERLAAHVNGFIQTHTVMK